MAPPPRGQVSPPLPPLPGDFAGRAPIPPPPVGNGEQGPSVGQRMGHGAKKISGKFLAATGRLMERAGDKLKNAPPPVPKPPRDDENPPPPPGMPPPPQALPGPPPPPRQYPPR
jgi:hypothetical protein